VLHTLSLHLPTCPTCRAHNTLFIAELAKHQELLPAHLRSAAGKGKAPAKRKRSAQGAAAGASDSETSDSEASDWSQEAGHEVQQAPKELGRGKRLTASRAKRQAAQPTGAAGSSDGSCEEAGSGKPSKAVPVPGKRGSSKAGRAAAGTALQQAGAAAATYLGSPETGSSKRRMSLSSSGSMQTWAGSGQAGAAMLCSPGVQQVQKQQAGAAQRKGSMSFFFDYDWDE
jgi:hypothetical protein